MRVYVPATLPLLGRWLEAAQIPPGTAYAVSPSLREWYREGDTEELEYVAQTAAARAALDLLAADPSAHPRRVVVAADAPDADVAPVPGEGRGAVRVGAVLPLVRWASALVDDPAATDVVAAAVAALPAAAAGDDDAAFALDEAEATELGWYAVQELPTLLG